VLREQLENMTKDELIGLRRKLQLKGASNLNKVDLISLLLKHPGRIKTLLNPKAIAEPEKSKLSSRLNLIAAFIFFIIMFCLFWYGRFNPTETKNIINNDEAIAYVTIIQNIDNGRLYSLTDFRHREIPPIDFRNYKNSLWHIDYLPNIGSFKPEIDYKKYWKYTFSTEAKRDLLIYSFWRWMMEFSQAYILSSETKDTGVNNYRNGTLINDEGIDERRVIDESNELLSKHNTMIFLPNSAKLEKSKYGYLMETEHSIITFNFSQGNQQKIRFDDNNFSNMIFNEYNLDITKPQNQITFTIQIKYDRKKTNDDSKLANFEHRWFSTIKNNVNEDFNFELLKNKFLKL